MVQLLWKRPVIDALVTECRGSLVRLKKYLARFDLDWERVVSA